MIKKHALAFCALIFLFQAVSAEKSSGFLGGFETDASLDVLGMAGIADSSEAFPVGLSVRAFSIPLAGLRYSAGLSLESDIVNSGFLCELGAALPLDLGGAFSFEPGAFLAAGWRYQGYPIASGLFYGAASAELSLSYAFSRHFSLRLGMRASLYYLDGRHVTQYQGQRVVTNAEPSWIPAFPLFLSCRFSL